MIKIADLMADLYEGNSDAQKNGFVGGDHRFDTFGVSSKAK